MTGEGYIIYAITFRSNEKGLSELFWFSNIKDITHRIPFSMSN